MDEEQFKPVLRSWFESNGFAVTDIPTANHPTPDFRIGNQSEEFLVELKIKSDDPEKLVKDSAGLSSGRILERAVPLTRRNRLETIVEEGYEQMKSFDPKKRLLHFLWIHCCGRDAWIQEERFRMTLFGQQRLVSTERRNVLHAFYFLNSTFWHYRDSLDGVFLSVGDELKLCVNTLGVDEQRLRASQVFAMHSNALCDPRALQEDPTILLVDGGVDRNDELAVLAFLRAKYSLSHLQLFQIGAYSAAVASRFEQQK